MADLIELDLVVREKGLKQSLSTVERLERQLTKAAKAIDENRISQDRYNKILLSAKRQYEALGVSSQKATASVRKFAESQRGAMGTTDNLTNSIKRQTEAQMAATKQSNRMGVVTQQAGYQVSDFIVQVQSGTNVFVAFGQQASQLVGILPLMASSIGLTTGAAIALSAALGIIIPLVTAVGAAFLRAKETSADAGDALYTFKEASTAAAQEVKSLTIENYMLTKGIESSKVAMLDFAIAAQEAKTAANDLANETSILFGPNGIFELGGGFTVLGFEIVKTDEEKLALLKEQRQTIIDQNEQLRIQKDNKQTLLDIEKAHNKYLEEQKEAEEELAKFKVDTLTSLRRRNQLAQAFIDGGEKAVEAEKEYHKNLDFTAAIQEKLAKVEGLSADEKEIQLQSILRQLSETKALEEVVRGLKEQDAERLEILKAQANTPIYEPLSQAQLAAKEAQEELVKGFEAAMGLKEEIGEGAYEALRLAGVDVAKPIEDAALAAANLAADLNISLAAATAMKREAAGEEFLMGLPVVKGKVTDRFDVDALLGMGYTREYLISIGKIRKETKKATEATKDLRTAYQKAMMSAQEFADALDNQVLNAVDGVSNAFSDFLAGGLRDFKDFVGSIKDMFIRLLADMAAMALKRRILIPIATGMAAGFGSSAAASSMGSFASGTLGASLAGGAAALGSGFMAGVQGFMGGGISGYGATLSATALNAGPLATIGAAIPAIAAVVAVIGLFTKKTKLLDSGLRTTVEGFDIAIDTFAKTQSSRLFGLLKGRKKTTYTAAEAELADPLIQAIGDMQQSIVDAAGTLGIGAEAFDNFSYQFKLSLKGLTEEEQLQKINEEILKMGDAFASLTGHFSTMNELLAVAQQRYDLTTRLLQLQGNEEELIARYREQERAATHELNQDLLNQIYALEDQQIAVQQLTNAYNEASAVANQAERDLSSANSALAEAERNVQQAASELQRLLDESLDTALAGLERAIDARRDSINQKYDTLISGLEDRLDAANEAASRSAEVYSILSGALSGRSIGGITFASRQAARAYVAGGGSDVERLQAAVEVLSEPSRQLFGSFEDYARDFAITSNVLKESKDAAEAQMTADEKTVALLQEQIEQADREREDQLRLLDEQLEAAKLQIDALKGIDTTMLSVDEAMQNVRDAMATYEQTQANHVELNTSVLSIGEAITQLASAVSAQAAAQAAAAAAQQAQAAAAAKAAEAQQQLAVAQSGAVTDVNSTAAKMSLDTAAKISAATPASASEQAMLNRFSGGQRPDHIQLAIAKGYQYDPVAGGYRKFAAGGMHSGGLRLVGEQGPELEVTGPSRIYSNSSTRSMLSNPELVSEIKELRREIADTKAEQRAANVAMVKYNKRTSDQLRTWNAVGLPQERTV